MNFGSAFPKKFDLFHKYEMIEYYDAYHRIPLLNVIACNP
jgi:hypothetical protein